MVVKVKKYRAQKAKCAKKRKFKIEEYENCLEVAQLENKINPPEKS